MREVAEEKQGKRKRGKSGLWKKGGAAEGSRAVVVLTFLGLGIVERQ